MTMNITILARKGHITKWESFWMFPNGFSTERLISPCLFSCWIFYWTLATASWHTTHTNNHSSLKQYSEICHSPKFLELHCLLIEIYQPIITTLHQHSKSCIIHTITLIFLSLVCYAPGPSYFTTTLHHQVVSVHLVKALVLSLPWPVFTEAVKKLSTRSVRDTRWLASLLTL